MLLPLFLIDALAAICLLYLFFSPLLSPIFTSFPLDFLFAGSVAAAPRHLPLAPKGGFWTVHLHTIVPLSKRLPFPKGELSAEPTEGLPFPKGELSALAD